MLLNTIFLHQVHKHFFLYLSALTSILTEICLQMLFIEYSAICMIPNIAEYGGPWWQSKMTVYQGHDMYCS